jgi:hypothetical protein
MDADSLPVKAPAGNFDDRPFVCNNELKGTCTMLAHTQGGLPATLTHNSIEVESSDPSTVIAHMNLPATIAERPPMQDTP